MHYDIYDSGERGEHEKYVFFFHPLGKTIVGFWWLGESDVGQGLAWNPFYYNSFNICRREYKLSSLVWKICGLVVMSADVWKLKHLYIR
jgi:hypothetical protein